MISIDIVFSAENRSETLHLPIIPETLDISFPHQNMTISTISDGDVNLIGMPGLKTISFSSWFPMKTYQFAKSSVTGVEGKAFLTKWKRKRRPIRVVVINKNGIELHNELYAIENFTFGYDRAGDMTYSLNLKQFVSKQVKK